GQVGRWHSLTLDCERGIAGLLQAAGRLEEADKRLARILDGYKRTAPVRDIRAQRVRLDQAALQRLQGRYAKADTLLTWVLSKPESPEITRRAKALLAMVKEDLGEFPGAETLTREVLQQEIQTLGADHPDTLATRTALAGLQRHLGDHAEAERTLVDVLEKSRAKLGAKHQTTLAVMNDLGLVYEEQGLYDRAEPLFREALDLSKDLLGPGHPNTIATMNSLALLHESQGDFDRAEPLYGEAIEQSAQRLGRTHPDTLAFVNNLAYLDLMRQDYPAARKGFAEVVKEWTGQLGERHQKTLKGMNNLARVQHRLGQHAPAEQLFNKTLELRRSVLGAEHPDTLRSMLDLAALLVDMGRLKEADQLFRRTLELDEKILGPRHPYTFETLNGLAALLEKQGKLEDAFQLRRKGFERRTEFLDRMMWVTGDNAREGYVRLHRPELDAYLDLLTRLDPARAGREVLAVAMARKGLLLRISSQIQQIARLSDDPQLAELTTGLTQVRKKLAALTLAGPEEGKDSGEAHLARLNELEERIQEIEGRLGQASQRFRQSVAGSGVDDLAKSLPDNGVLVDFLTFTQGGKQKLIAGLLTRGKGGKPAFHMAVYEDLDAIQKLVVEYRTVIQDEESDEDNFLEVGGETYQQVWEPLAAFIGPRTDVFVVPDGILNILPFGALVDDAEQYLIRTVDLRLLNSSRDLLPSQLPPAQGPLVTLAGPDYDTEKVAGAQVLSSMRGRRSAGLSAGVEVSGTMATDGDGAGRRSLRSGVLNQLRAGLRAFSQGMRGLRFDPLPGAEKEGKLIAEQEQRKENRLFLRNDAQEEVIKDLTQVPGILHIATHGFFLKADDSLRKRLLRMQRGAEIHLPPPGDNPLLRSGLAFAGINANAPFLGEIDTGNDGVLTALEVLGLNLTGTRLAVLSACETGLGEIHEGEGVYGLRRAFQEAGVKSVVASLWEVSDAGTQALMTGLYRRLAGGASPRTALRDSQIELMDSDQWNAPYIWSAFMIVGL
ncbi:MAG: CHAT domain-containing protein, partial [Magnetococcales bacterium]|nr:CHAT domain-containing protein [Magnetococcales bacterium]